MKKSAIILPAVLALGAVGFLGRAALDAATHIPDQDKNRIAADFKGAAERNRLGDMAGAGGYFLGVEGSKSKAYEDLMTAEAQKNGYRLCSVEKWKEDTPGYMLFASFGTARYGDIQYALVADKDERDQAFSAGEGLTFSQKCPAP